MALSLGVEGVSYPERGQWQETVAHRWLNGDQGYIGDRVAPNYKRSNGSQIDIHSVDLQVTYAFTKRYSATLTMPFVHGEVSNFAAHENDGIHRHTTSAGGLGFPQKQPPTMKAEF